MNRLFMLLALLFLSFSATVASTWKADKVHSHINFSVTHNLIAEVQGTFREYDIDFSSDREDFTDARVNVTVKTGTIFTGNERRDGHLMSDDFFGTDQFPDMTFQSNRFEKTGERTYRIHGDLTIRDVTKPVVLETRHKGTIQDPRMGTRAGFKATCTIDRFDFNLKWDAALEAGGFIVSRDVDIIILLELVQQQ